MATDGTYWTILSSLQGMIANNEFGNSQINTVIRRKLQKLDSDSLPIIIIAPGQDSIREQTFNKQVWWNYEVLVAYIEAANRAMTIGLEAWMNNREQLRNLLFQPLNTDAPSTVFDFDIDPEDVVKFQEYLGTNYDVTGFKVTYTSSEGRT